MIMRKQVEGRKRSIKRRLNGPVTQDFSRPMFSASNLHYELAERTRAISHGGIGLVHRLVGEEEQHWDKRGHFFGAAARAMRRILVDDARCRGRENVPADIFALDVHRATYSQMMTCLREVLL